MILRTAREKNLARWYTDIHQTNSQTTRAMTTGCVAHLCGREQKSLRSILSMPN